MTKKKIEEANRKVQNLDSVDVVLKGSSKKESGNASDKSNSKHKKSDSKKSQKQSQGPVIPAERIKKATKRNQNTPKPAKGLWGLIKSFFS